MKSTLKPLDWLLKTSENFERFTIPCAGSGFGFKMKKGHENDYVLQSYETLVGAIRKGRYICLWGGYSISTRAHITMFLKWAGFEPLSKFNLDRLGVGDSIKLNKAV